MPLIMFESEEDSQKVIKKANIWITKHPKHIIKGQTSMSIKKIAVIVMHLNQPSTNFLYFMMNIKQLALLTLSLYFKKA